MCIAISIGNWGDWNRNARQSTHALVSLGKEREWQDARGHIQQHRHGTPCCCVAFSTLVYFTSWLCVSWYSKSKNVPVSPVKGCSYFCFVVQYMKMSVQQILLRFTYSFIFCICDIQVQRLRVRLKLLLIVTPRRVVGGRVKRGVCRDNVTTTTITVLPRARAKTHTLTSDVSDPRVQIVTFLPIL